MHQRFLRSWPMIMLVTACHGGGPPRRAGDELHTSGAPPAEAEAQSYRGLLQAGARWTFEVRHGTVGSYDPRELDAADGDERLACWVTDVVELAGGRAADVECDDALGGPDNLLRGTWAETSEGLFKLGWLPEAGTTLPDDADLFLSSRPTAREDTVTHPPDREAGEETSETDRVEGVEGGWCRIYEYGATYGQAQMLCVGADGPIDGGWIQEDLEEIHATYFVRVRR